MITHIQSIDSGKISINGSEEYNVNRGAILHVSVCETDNDTTIIKHIKNILKANFFDRGTYNLRDENYSLIVAPQKLMNEDTKPLRVAIMESNENEMTKEIYKKFIISLENERKGIIKIYYEDIFTWDICVAGPINYILEN